MMFIGRHLLEALLSPYFLLLALLALSLLWLCLRGHSKRTYYVLFISIVSLWGLSLGFLPQWLTHKLERQYPPIVDASADIRWIVVLGGGQAQYAKGNAEQVLSSASIRRLLEGVRLSRQLPLATLVLSGGSYEGKFSEAEEMQRLLNSLTVPDKKVFLDTQSLNTAEQARTLQPLLKNERFYLVTSAIHMPRAVALFKRLELKPIPAPTDFTYYWDDERWEKTYLPNPSNLVYLNIAWHEILGQAWAKLRGQI